MSLLLLLASALLVVYVVIHWIKDRKRLPLPPGPNALECLKLLGSFILRNNMYIESESLSKRYGEIFTLRILGKNLIFLNSSRIIRKVLTAVQYREVTNDRPASFYSKFFNRGKDLVLRNNDKGLVKLRKLVHGTVKLYGGGFQAFENMVNKEIYNLEEQLSESNTTGSFDMDRALTTSLIRILYIFLTNEEPTNTEEVVSAVTNSDAGANRMFRFDTNLIFTLFPWLRFVPGPTKRVYDEFVRNRLIMDAIFLNPESKKKMKASQKGLLGVLLNEVEHDSDFDDQTVYGVFRNIIAAGYLTTKGVLGGFFLLMISFPDIQRRIQEEIDEKVGSRRPSLEDRALLHFTNATILECLRIIRHVPLGVPHRLRTEIEVEGFRIPANATLITNLWAVLHSSSEWNDPGEFRPDRFLDNEGKLLLVDHPLRQQLIMFGTGRRVCVGEAFAKSRIFLYVTSLLQKFTFIKGDNKLPSSDSSTWENNLVLHPEAYCCGVIKR